MTEQEYTQEEWTYAGLRWSWSKHKLYHEWHTPEGPKWYSKSLRAGSPARVGGIYRVTIKADGSVIIGGHKEPLFIQFDREHAADWDAESRGAEAEARAWKDREKAARVHVLQEALAPWRERYQASSPSARAKLLADVIQALQS